MADDRWLMADVEKREKNATFAFSYQSFAIRTVLCQKPPAVNES
jgi:hypothetical protein